MILIYTVIDEQSKAILFKSIYEILWTHIESYFPKITRLKYTHKARPDSIKIQKQGKYRTLL